jgi:hypothetical protein
MYARGAGVYVGVYVCMPVCVTVYTCIQAHVGERKPGARKETSNTKGNWEPGKYERENLGARKTRSAKARERERKSAGARTQKRGSANAKARERKRKSAKFKAQKRARKDSAGSAKAQARRPKESACPALVMMYHHHAMWEFLTLINMTQLTT